jgi:hypothetical protein
MRRTVRVTSRLTCQHEDRFGSSATDFTSRDHHPAGIRKQTRNIAHPAWAIRILIWPHRRTSLSVCGYPMMGAPKKMVRDFWMKGPKSPSCRAGRSNTQVLPQAGRSTRLVGLCQRSRARDQSAACATLCVGRVPDPARPTSRSTACAGHLGTSGCLSRNLAR